MHQRKPSSRASSTTEALHTVNNSPSANTHFRGTFGGAALPGLRPPSLGSLNASVSPSRSSCPLGCPASAPFRHLLNDTNDDSDAQPARPRRRPKRGRFTVRLIERWKLAFFITMTPVVKMCFCPVHILIHVSTFCRSERPRQRDRVGEH